MSISQDQIKIFIKFLIENQKMIEEILNSELSMPNIKMKTMGWEVFWDTLVDENG